MQTQRQSPWRRLRWVAAGAGLLLLFFILRPSGESAYGGSSGPAPTVSPQFEFQIRDEPSLAAECSEWEYTSLSPSRDVKLLTAQFFLPHNLSFVLIGPRTSSLCLRR